MTSLMDLECLKPVTVLCVLTGHAPPQQLGLCTSRPKKFQAALLRLRNRSSMIHSKLLSVAILIWTSYQLVNAFLRNKQYSYYATLATYSLPSLTMYAKLWINGGNHEIRHVFSKLTEVDELLVISGDQRPGNYWVKSSCRYASFIVIFFLFNSLLYVYSILQFLSSETGDIDGFTILVLHVLNNVIMLEFLSFVSLIRNRFHVLNSHIEEFSYIPVAETSNNTAFKSVHKRRRAMTTNFHRELGELNRGMFHLQSHIDNNHKNRSVEDSWVGDDDQRNGNLLVKIKTIYNNHTGPVEFAFQPKKNSTGIDYWDSDYFSQDGGLSGKASLEPEVVQLKKYATCRIPCNHQTGNTCLLKECSGRKISLRRDNVLKMKKEDSLPSYRLEHDVAMKIISGLSKRLDVLRLAHHSLNEVSDLVNRRYSIFLLSEVCSVFLVLVVCAHVVLNIQTLSHMTGPFTVYSMIIWIVVTVTRIIILIFFSRRVTDEASKTVHLVTMPRQSPAIQSLWDAFSLQLVHCRCVQFNAGGVFPIRLQLLFSIVGATATYLIVLQQYKDIRI